MPDKTCTGVLMHSPTFTNVHNLPTTLMNLALRDRYSRGDSAISVTQLIDSPRIRMLRARHGGQIVEDIADRIWALVGSALHHVVEQGSDDEHLAEERLFAQVNGWRISGGVDLQRVGDGKVALSDYKFTSVYSVLNAKVEWERQLNCYAWLVEATKGLTVTGLTINAVIRDWNRHEAKVREGYPPAAITVVPQPLWPFDQREAYVRERVLLHQEAERRDGWGEVLPDCSDSERWHRPGKIAVVKPNLKRAIKLFDDMDEARVFAAEKGAQVEVRPASNLRCEEFCAVSTWCQQWADIQETANAQGTR